MAARAELMGGTGRSRIVHVKSVVSVCDEDHVALLAGCHRCGATAAFTDIHVMRNHGILVRHLLRLLLFFLRLLFNQVDLYYVLVRKHVLLHQLLSVQVPHVQLAIV